MLMYPQYICQEIFPDIGAFIWSRRGGRPRLNMAYETGKGTGERRNLENQKDLRLQTAQSVLLSSIAKNSWTKRVHPQTALQRNPGEDFQG